jgi:HSP20 family protein
MPIDTASDQPFGTVLRQMNKMVDQLQKNFFSYCPRETWMPDVNLYETEAGYIVCVDLAGVNKGEIDLQLVDSQLRLKGTRTAPRPPQEASAARVKVHLMEIDHGAFCRTVDLPRDVNKGRIKAEYDNGMLWVEIPKK